ncbi:MAG: isoprenyl transferase [Clostridia bacterium]|nr:isoprenyl transferase [Clostridia bacterium]
MSFFRWIFKRNRNKVEIDEGKLPDHIAIIMDGNGRWAKRRGLPRNVGHREGANALRRVVLSCNEIGIKYLTVYAFSTENWKRPKSEVDALMNLLIEFLKSADRELAGKNVRICVIGDVEGLPLNIQKEIQRVTKSTSRNTGLNFNIALNYGSRAEMLYAVKAVADEVKKGKMKIDEISEQVISERLYTREIPDPDLIIRTSGEQRISNFLLWQIAYAEFWFTDVLWPDFNGDILLEAVKQYQNRNRRFGGI